MSDKDIGIGNSNGGGPLSTGGPLGGPGRPGKRLMAAQQDSGDYTGPGVPTNPLRETTSQGNPRVRGQGKPFAGQQGKPS